jgi:hypothetical protein
MFVAPRADSDTEVVLAIRRFIASLKLLYVGLGQRLRRTQEM